MMRVLAVVPNTRRIEPAWSSIQAATCGVDTLYLRAGDLTGVPYQNNVEVKLRFGKAMMLAGNYDAAWFIDDDNILPMDALARMVKHLDGGADVVYGLNCWRNVPHHWSATFDRVDDKIDTLNMHREQAAQVWGQTIPVLGIGFYCTLVSKKALEATPMLMRGVLANDCYSADDWKAAGLLSVCDTSLLCGHMLDAHKAVWPALDGAVDWYYRMEAH